VAAWQACCLAANGQLPCQCSRPARQPAAFGMILGIISLGNQFFYHYVYHKIVIKYLNTDDTKKKFK
jgi:hypothetical protein